MDNLTNICEATSQSHELDNYRPTHRKGKKLLAEKKRRARINNCLMQIRNIVCEGEEEKDTDLEKMEKAEILEKTLEVLTRLRHDYSPQSSSSFSARKAMAVRYASGFSSCAEESIRYIQNSRLVPAEVKVQLQNHLRAIAHRMEASLQGDSQSLNFSSSYQASPSLSSPSSSTERITSMGDIREDTSGSSIDKVPSQSLDVGTYYIPSPVHFSSPRIQSHIPFTTAISQSHQQDEEHTCLPETVMKHNFGEQQMKPTENLTGDTSNIHPQIKSVDKDECTSYAVSLFHQPETLSSECSKEKQCVTSFMSHIPSYPMSMPSFNEATPPINSPVILYSTPVLPNTPLLSSQQVLSYHVYEPHPTCTVSSILVQPVTYLSTPVRHSQTMVSSAPKHPGSMASVLDLCIKRNDDHQISHHQISPETMWRPW